MAKEKISKTKRNTKQNEKKRKQKRKQKEGKKVYSLSGNFLKKHGLTFNTIVLKGF